MTTNQTRRLCARWVVVVIGLIGGSAWSFAIAEDNSPFTAAQRSHWAFQPIRRPATPRVADANCVKNPVDAFLVSRLGSRGLRYSSPADKRTLLRRVKFDLSGLPPTAEEIAEFVADVSADAYERLVDRLLASPQYGEAWGRDWLDLVRFAETSGYNADPPRPLAYKYRDYVIRAFNDDRPYDRFVCEQIAGDELFPDDAEASIAAGYNRLWPDESNASDILLARQDALNDLTANVGAVFLGLSIGCAQCHDHKFEPLLQNDFYALQAHFSGIVPQDRVALGGGDQLAAYQQALAAWRQVTAELRSTIHSIEQAARAKAGSVKRLKFPEIVLAAIDTAPETRTAFQRQLVFWSERQIIVNDTQLLAAMSDADRARLAEAKSQLEARLAEKPEPPAWLDAMTVCELPGDMPPTFLLAGGSYRYPLEEVQPAPPQILAGAAGPESFRGPTRPGTSGRRAALARWLVSRDNPLVARVMVNRIWQGHFGRGLVENANDFGTMTPQPIHADLLDWLASEFVNQGWSVKAVHRMIVTSDAYRQAAEADDNRGREHDPENALYWHFPRRRLSAERIRDAMLAAAGDLDQRMYGPGVRPPLPPNSSKREKWDLSPEADWNRRSVYLYAKRNLPFPMLQVFDLPDMHESCARRMNTTTAPQALALLNDKWVLDTGRRFAQRLLGANTGDLQQVVNAAYVETFGRHPARDEAAQAVAFIEQQRDLIARESQATSAEGCLAEAVADFCHALLNANEFLYVE